MFTEIYDSYFPCKSIRALDPLQQKEAEEAAQAVENLKADQESHIGAIFRATLPSIPLDCSRIVAAYDEDSCNEIIDMLHNRKFIPIQKPKESLITKLIASIRNVSIENNATPLPKLISSIANEVTTLNLNSYKNKIFHIEKIFEYFKNIKDLTVQERTAHYLTDKDFTDIANLHFLQSLSLKYCSNIKPAIFNHLNKLNNLTSLDLRDCMFPTDNLHFDGVATGLAQLNVTSLRLSRYTDYGLAKLLVTNLKSIELINCEFTDAGLASLTTNIPNLRSIVLDGCSGVTDTGIASLTTLKFLQSLNLSYCKKITDKGIIKVVEGLPNLQSLDLVFIGDEGKIITDESLTHIIKSLSALRSLNLSSCISITDNSIVELKNHQNLKSLNLYNCVQITNNGLIQLVENLQNLQDLNVSKCPKITEEGIEDIKKINPSIEVMFNLDYQAYHERADERKIHWIFVKMVEDTKLKMLNRNDLASNISKVEETGI